MTESLSCPWQHTELKVHSHSSILLSLSHCMMLLGNATLQCIARAAEHKNGGKKIHHTKEKSDGSCANVGQEKKII